MDTALQAETTIADQMPWLGMTLAYMEKISALIPEDRLDWRPLDPSGKFCFSLGEIAMHCADARLMFARQLAGDDSEEGFWSPGPDENGVWSFGRPASRQAILDSLVRARGELEKYTALPASRLLEVTEGTRAVFERNLARFRESGSDTADMERRGPASIMRVLMAAATHEAGHRGSLQTLLRQQGLNVGEE